ncbi:unnamed protein product [Protopolystoma xenopodis]|uniref:Uncharacterized protein n=1 Tax=Protopolystoma xenopodis TaxID=117903 RepID=A0A3S5A910_9PLAT|nr:unnamed protein product [Protopolystoma xenopodis]
MAKLTDDADYDAGEQFENLLAHIICLAFAHLAGVLIGRRGIATRRFYVFQRAWRCQLGQERLRATRRQVVRLF